MTTSNAAPMVRVPVEPTQAMIDAARNFSVPGYCIAAEQWPRVWAAMLSAAPAPQPVQGEGEGKWKAIIAGWQARAEAAGYEGVDGVLEAVAPAPAPAESQPQGVEAVGFRYRIAPSDECRSRPWAGAGIVAEWGKPAPPDNSTIQYQTLYAPAAQIAAPGDPWPTTEADEAAMALAAEDMGNPAWWRGHDEACTILCQKVNAILDGNDDGRGVANDPWESTRRRLLALVAAPGDVEERARELLDAECIKRAPRSSALVSVSTALRAITAALRSQGQADAVELRGVRDTLIVAANNPVSHGGLGGLRELMLTQAHRITAALAQQVPADGEALARRFHEAYERLAPSFGYETRTETRQFDPATPNGRLMIAVCSELASTPQAPQPVVDVTIGQQAVDVEVLRAFERKFWQAVSMTDSRGFDHDVCKEVRDFRDAIAALAATAT